MLGWKLVFTTLTTFTGSQRPTRSSERCHVLFGYSKKSWWKWGETGMARVVVLIISLGIFAPGVASRTCDS